MSPDLEQLFRDSHSVTPPSRVDLDAVVRRGRRVRVRHQVRGAATIGVTGAVVLGLGAVAVSGTGRLGGVPLLGAGSGDGSGPPACQMTSSAQAANASPAPTGDPQGAAATSGSGVGSPPPATASPSSGSDAASPPAVSASGSTGSWAPASSSPASTDGSVTPSPGDATSEAVPGSGSVLPSAVKPDGPPPAALTAVRLPDPAPGFGARRAPDSVGLEAGSSDGHPHWTAVFLVGRPCEHEATVMVGDFPWPAEVPKPTGADGLVVGLPSGLVQPGAVTHEGEQTILYFTTSRFTVKVVGGHGTTIEELLTLATSLENID